MTEYKTETLETTEKPPHSSEVRVLLAMLTDSTSACRYQIEDDGEELTPEIIGAFIPMAEHMLAEIKISAGLVE